MSIDLVKNDSISCGKGPQIIKGIALKNASRIGEKGKNNSPTMKPITCKIHDLAQQLQ